MFVAKKSNPVYQPVDTFYRYNSLLLHAESITASTTTDNIVDISTLPPFADSSQNNLAITTVGALSPGTFNPYNPLNGRGYSAFFDGVGDYFTVPYSAANFSMGSGDFSIECWVNPRNPQPEPSTVGYIIWAGTTAGSNISWAVRVVAGSLSASPVFQFVTSGGSIIGTTTSDGSNGNISWNVANGQTLRNRWYHLLVAKIGTTAALYVNGKYAAAVSFGTSLLTPDTVLIGASVSTITFSDFFHGHISNLKVVKGVNPLFKAGATASNLTSGYYFNGVGVLPSKIYSTSNTVLMTLQNSYMKDNSPNNLTLTRVGDINIQPFSPLPTGPVSYSGSNHNDTSSRDKPPPSNLGAMSVYNDASTRYLIMRDGLYQKATQLRTGDFCVEAWVYFTVLAANRVIVESWTTNNGWQLYYTNTTAKFAWFVNNGILLSSTTTPVVGQWYHVAVSRSSGTSNMFVNGILESSSSTAGSLTDYTPTAPLATGIQFSTLTNPMAGYISDIRITTGNAIYVGNFTPSEGPLLSVDGTQFLLKTRDIGIKDSTGKNSIQALGGSAGASTGSTAISTNIKKFNNASIFFDGVNDYLTMHDSTLFDFGASPFTIEAWIYRTGGGTKVGQAVISQSIGLAASDSAFYFGAGSDGLALYLSTSGTSWTNFIETATATTLNTWTHVVWQRRFEVQADKNYGNSYLEIYLNGVLQTVSAGTSLLGSNTTRVFNSSRKIDIGSQNGVSLYNGYIDEMRVTLGVARYGGTGATGSNFTSPSSPFPNR